MRSPYVLFACLLASSTTLLQKAPTHAQITPDPTLGAESSVIRSGVEIDGAEAELIEGGATRGNNLFHSFSDFNVGTSERVYFDSPENIETILGRVTGNNLSSINGRLGTTGDSDAALILMNPNGIVFGAGSSLDTQGAFTATTATGIQLGEDGLFSAVAPQSDRLLSVDPSAFFFNELGSTSAGISLEGAQLQMANGEAFRLLGREVAIDSGGISAPNSQVEIVAVGDVAAADVGEEGAIALGEEGGRGNIAIENGSFIDVRSPEGGTITLVGGDIQVLSSSLLLAGVQTSLDQGNSTSEEDPPNFIELDATGLVRLSGAGTIVESSVLEGAVGKADGVVIEAGSIELSEGAQVYSITLGQGSAGDVSLSADSDISITGNAIAITATEGEGDAGSINITSAETVEIVGGREPRAAILSGTTEDSKGSSGNINITAENFYVSGGVSVATFSVGSSGTGDILIDVDENIRLGVDGSSEEAGSIDNLLGEQSLEPGGDIKISAGSIEVLNGFAVSTGTFGEARAGNVAITASDSLRIAGADLVSELPLSSHIHSLSSGTGQAGDVEVVAGSLEVAEGGRISSGATDGGGVGDVDVRVSGDATFDGFNPRALFSSGIGSPSPGSGIGDGGAIRLSARNLSITNGAELSVSLSSTGSAGNIDIDVLETVWVDGINSETGVPSSIDSNVSSDGRGKGGDIEVAASEVILTNGGQISASVFGVGEAGNVAINASGAVRIDGVNPANEKNPSGVESSIQPNAIGDAGTVTITAGSLEVTNGGQIDTTSFGRGDAGRIVINAADMVRLDGVTPTTGATSSLIESSIQPNAIGDAGTVTITTSSLEVTNGGQIGTASFGRGDAGRIVINAADTVRLDGVYPVTGTASSLISSSIQPDAIGDGGTVTITTDSLEITNGGQINTSSFSRGDAGRIVINAADTVRLDGADPVTGTVPSVITSSIQPGAIGDSGTVTITTGSLEATNGGAIDTASFGRGDAGRIVINASDTVRLDGGIPVTGIGASTISSSIQPNAIGDGGTVEISADELYVSGGAQINTSIFGTGNAGDILLNINGTIQLSGEDTEEFPSGIGSTVEPEGSGNGGNLDISATNLYIAGDSQLTAVNLGQGNAGRIFLDVDERVRVEGRSGILTRSVAGSGGEIVIQADGVILREDGDIRTLVNEGGGTSGNLTIDANYVVALDDGDILAFSVDGRGGDVDLSQTTLFSQTPNAAPADLNADTLNALSGNNRVDINASGGVASGQVLINDASFIEAELAELPSTLVDTDSLIANTCIAARQDDASTFVVRARDRTPLSPTNPLLNNYSLGTIQPIAEPDSALTIQEPEAIYQTSDGRLLISHRCRS